MRPYLISFLLLSTSTILLLTILTIGIQASTRPFELFAVSTSIDQQRNPARTAGSVPKPTAQPPTILFHDDVRASCLRVFFQEVPESKNFYRVSAIGGATGGIFEALRFRSDPSAPWQERTQVSGKGEWYVDIPVNSFDPTHLIIELHHSTVGWLPCPAAQPN